MYTTQPSIVFGTAEGYFLLSSPCLSRQQANHLSRSKLCSNSLSVAFVILYCWLSLEIVHYTFQYPMFFLLAMRMNVDQFWSFFISLHLYSGFSFSWLKIFYLITLVFPVVGMEYNFSSLIDQQLLDKCTKCLMNSFYLLASWSCQTFLHQWALSQIK